MYPNLLSVSIGNFGIWGRGHAAVDPISKKNKGNGIELTCMNVLHSLKTMHE